MERVYQLVCQSGERPLLTVAASTAARLGLEAGRASVLLAGNRRMVVNVVVQDGALDDTLALTRPALQPLLLDSETALEFTYRIKQENGALRLGPVIGLLIGMSRDEIPRNKHGYRIFDTLWAIRRIGGLVYFFTAGDIDWQGKRIFGHVHFARRDNSLLPSQIAFKTAWFPFPQAIYRRGRIAPAVVQRIHREMTPYSFNTPRAAGRLQQINAIRSAGELRLRVPWTEPLSAAALQRMVRRYGAAYVKASGYGAGKSVHKVEAARTNAAPYRVISRVTPRSPAETSRFVSSFDELLSLLSADLGRPWSPGLWTVQQGIRPARWQGRPFDLRITVQRNGRGNWIVNGAYARVAPAPDAAVTRLGEYRNAREVITTIWPGDGERIVRTVRRMGLLCAQALGRRFQILGDVGVDLLLDRRGEPWFLEANAGPGYRPIHSGDNDYWWQLIQPILFASYLSGFPISVERADLLAEPIQI